MDNVYFDYAATTPVDERVLDAMMPFFSERFGNANSLYGLGRDAYRALEDARERFAQGINAATPERGHLHQRRNRVGQRRTPRHPRPRRA